MRNDSYDSEENEWNNNENARKEHFSNENPNVIQEIFAHPSVGWNGI